MKTKIYICMFTLLLSVHFVFAQPSNKSEWKEINIVEKSNDASCESCHDNNSDNKFKVEFEPSDYKIYDNIRVVCQQKSVDTIQNVTCSTIRPESGWGTILQEDNTADFIYKEGLYSGGGHINSITFVDHNNGWAVGRMENHSISSGVIFKTENSGRTWKLQFTSGTPMKLTVVSFSDAKNGLATGVRSVENLSFDIILVTTDGGNTWFEESIVQGNK